MLEVSEKTVVKSTELVQSLVKGLTVIQAFNQKSPTMTLSEVANVTGFTRATSRRFLLTLVHEGYAKQEGKQFSLTAKVLNLGYSYLSSLDIWHSVKPIMQDLVERLNESCSAAVIDGEDVVYVARVATTKRLMSIAINVGTRLPAIATSMGRVLLTGLSEDELDRFLAKCNIEEYTPFTMTKPKALKAQIAQVKAQGYSMVEQELELGLTSISVPVHNRMGEVIAALNVSTHMSQTARKQILEVILPALMQAVKKIEQVG